MAAPCLDRVLNGAITGRRDSMPSSFEATARKIEPAAQPKTFRQSPHNVEAEQALLGAILVNNEAFYRVSDFLAAAAFLRAGAPPDLRGRVELIRGGKVATPITLKTFLGPDQDIGGLTVAQYLARLAAEATTVINAGDYGQTIYDLAIRRALILIGEDMRQRRLRRAGRHGAARPDRGRRAALYELAETGRVRRRLRTLLRRPHGRHRHGGRRLQARRPPVRPRHRPRRPRPRDGRPAALRPVILAGRPGMGKTSLATNIAFNVAKHYRCEVAGRRLAQDRRRRHRSASSRSKCRPSSSPPASSPSRPSVPSYEIRRGDIDRGGVRAARRRRPARCRRSRSTSTTPAASRSPSSPPARGG